MHALGINFHLLIWGRGTDVKLYLLQTPRSECLLAYPQLISRIEEGGLETEGLLRIPGAAMRIKVSEETLQFLLMYNFIV